MKNFLTIGNQYRSWWYESPIQAETILVIMANSRNIIDGCASVLSWAVTRTFKTSFSHVRKKYWSKKDILIFDYQMSTLKRYLRSSFVEAGRNEKSSGFNSVDAVLPVFLLLYLISAVVVAVLSYWRFVYFKTKYYWLRVQKSIATENYLFCSFFSKRWQKRSQSAGERSVQFDDLQNDHQNLTASTSNLVYQNVGDIRPSIRGI